MQRCLLVFLSVSSSVSAKIKTTASDAALKTVSARDQTNTSAFLSTHAPELGDSLKPVFSPHNYNPFWLSVFEGPCLVRDQINTSAFLSTHAPELGDRLKFVFSSNIINYLWLSVFEGSCLVKDQINTSAFRSTHTPALHV